MKRINQILILTALFATSWACEHKTTVQELEAKLKDVKETQQIHKRSEQEALPNEACWGKNTTETECEELKRKDKELNEQLDRTFSEDIANLERQIAEMKKQDSNK